MLNSKMSNSNTIIRYFLLIVGLFSIGLGVSLTTKSNLGTSPISSVPYQNSKLRS